tara:strand:+ start:1826 stop:4324 length:2499 start_codon:yes stop_codon:yes gene_type:complete
MAGYSRQSSSTIQPNEVIKAAPVNAEYNAIRDAFALSGGHKHDGSSTEGAYVPLIADTDALNKVVVDTSNNRHGVFVEVSSSAVEQVRFQDGVIVPVTDNDIDLGTSSVEFKDLYLDGTATVDTLQVDENATVTGNLSVNGNTTLGNAASDTVTVTADIASALLPSADDTHDLGATGSEWRDLYIDGQANIDTLAVDANATVAGTLIVTGATTLNGGLVMDSDKFTVADTSGNTSIGGTLTVAGATTLAATSFGDANITNVGDIALDSISADGSTITITGNTTFADGSFDFNIASHDGTNGLALGGTVVTATAAELNILDGVTATTAELNIMDGVTSTTAELNILDGVTASASEINALSGLTATAAELNTLDGVTAVVGELNALDLGSTAVGTAIASKAVVLDSNKDYTGIRNFTITGNLTVGGTTTVVDTVTMNAQNAVVFEGATADDHETTLTIVDPTADRTINLPNQSGTIPVLAAVSATQISATPEELNIMDGGTSATSTTLADADRVVVNDAGTMKQVALTDFETYFESALDTLSNVTTVGALNSGSISSGFGAIDNGSSAITTTGTVTYGSLSDGTITITGFVDEDDMSSNSATLVPTQQSVEARIQAVNATANNVTGLNATGPELNTVADVSAISPDTSTAVANNDAILMFDNSATGLKYFDVDLLDTYYAQTSKTLTNKTLTSPVVTGLHLNDAGFTVEGSSADGNETTIAFTDPTADRTITFPDATGTIALLASPTFTGTLTAPTINASTALQIGGVAVTSTAAELNILDGVTSTAAELNILDGVTATTAELNHVDGVTSNIQTQLNNAASTGKAIAMAMVFG